MTSDLAPALAILAYGALLVILARRVDRHGLPPRFSALVYPLSLAVYFSSWSFFGAVGTAATGGWPYLAIYLGPALVFLLLPGLLTRLATEVRAARALSVSDFLAQRFGRSRGLAALVTIVALVASVPYIALQLRSVAASFAVLTGQERTFGVALATAILLAAFAIGFGARRVEVARRNEGLLAAIAFESLVKIIALGALGGFALLLLAPGPVRVTATVMAPAFAGGPDPEFFAATLAAGLAILCLPRQFYVAFVEAPSPKAVEAARWPFLLYLAAVSLLALPLAAAGLSGIGTAVAPDLYVLAVPMAEARHGLALLAFVGGFSAATAMVIAETLALSTMATNDLIGPLLLQRRSGGDGADIGLAMRAFRRAVIILIIAAAFLYAEAVDDRRTLAAIGLIAFAGVAQFAPALLATLLFRLDNPVAARVGLAGGALVWLYTLFLPSIAGPGFATPLATATAGLLAPQSLFGVSMGSPLTHGLFWSLFINLLLLLAFARASGTIRLPRRAGALAQVRRMGDLTALVARFVGEAEAQAALGSVFGPADAPVPGAAARRAERLIAGVIGAPSARLVVGSVLAGESLPMNDVVKLLDASGQSVALSRSLLAATLEAIDQGVSVIDSNLRLVAWNARYLEVFDYPAGMVTVGRPVADLIRYNAERGECGPGEVEAHVARRLWHLSRGLPHSFERRRPSGRWIRTAGAPIPGGGYVMSFTDVTAERERQAELEREVAARTADLAAANRALDAAREAAERATRDKTRFLAAASHDLQQPLHAARLFAAALEPEVPEHARAMLRSISDSIRSADALLRALLDVSKLDAGGIVPVLSRFCALELVEELGREFQPLAAERGLRLAIRGRDAIVETDRALLRSILMNLLSNAVRYTGTGTILLAVRRRESNVRFEVRDSGPGIAEADQARIFREFERLPGSGDRGVGLGLAIVERTARLLGAELSLRSAPGRGSTFAVSLPLASGAVIALPRASAGPAVPAGRRVLCVDDDAAVRASVAALLGGAGYAVETAADAVSARRMAAAHVPDCAILDFHLGAGPDGLWLAQELRALAPAVRLLIVTGSPGQVDADAAARLGAAILAKPLEPDVLLDALAGRLEAAE
jgi:signal transduction histidine kinase/Na+/proline symporter/CheY-like chemotaxis protein